MKLTAVSDVFVSHEYYQNGVAKHPNFTLGDQIYFGQKNRTEMRETVQKIERGGAYAVDAPSELYKSLADTDVLMVHLCPVQEKIFDEAKNLKIILTNRGGIENIDVAAASKHGVAVLANPAHNANAVAEFTIGLMLAETRNIAKSHHALRSNVWCEKYPNSGNIYELKGLTVGLIGFGTIARIVAKFLCTFGCKILVSDPYLKADDTDLIKFGGTLVSLETLLSESDIISLHARADQNGPALIGEKEFALMKESAYLINTARSYLMDYNALYNALSQHKIRGAALDVFTKEPADFNDPIFALDNVTLANHRGGDTVNSYSDSPEMLLAEAEKLLNGDLNVKFWINRAETERFYK